MTDQVFVLSKGSYLTVEQIASEFTVDDLISEPEAVYALVRAEMIAVSDFVEWHNKVYARGVQNGSGEVL